MNRGEGGEEVTDLYGGGRRFSGVNGVVRWWPDFSVRVTRFAREDEETEAVMGVVRVRGKKERGAGNNGERGGSPAAAESNSGRRLGRLFVVDKRRERDTRAVRGVAFTSGFRSAVVGVGGVVWTEMAGDGKRGLRGERNGRRLGREGKRNENVFRVLG
ncbi:hypothetical protein HAX54_007902 [Datura stramonium]|uniref:Uncharacterized protein n=1 Tax=Datura stramonium TaxID=4076 RepID=A0ABS8TCE7_DATST|nr:hypothetical protein [Datura stramonium]